jgi:hypothetical protein
MVKMRHKETPQYLHDLVTLKNNKYNFRYSNTSHIPTVKTTRYGLNSFRYYASKTWNELPDHFRKETSEYVTSLFKMYQEFRGV